MYRFDRTVRTGSFWNPNNFKRPAASLWDVKDKRIPQAL